MESAKDSIVGIVNAVNVVEMSIFSMDRNAFENELKLFEKFRHKIEPAYNAETSERSEEFRRQGISSVPVKQEMLGILNEILVGLVQPKFADFSLKASLHKLASAVQDLEDSIEKSKHITSEGSSQQTTWRDMLIEARLETLKIKNER
jgi:hypothetical protein